MSKFTREGNIIEKRERERKEGGEIRGAAFGLRRALDIAPLYVPIYQGKGSRNLLLDLSRRLLTRVELPGI